MHTRSHLNADDFRFHGAATGVAGLMPEHTATSRVVFVAPDAAAGAADLAGLTLALAHAFYARPEAAAPDFYDYPSHFVVGGRDGAEPRLLHTAAAEPWSKAWCHLDVWPNTHHAVADPSPFALIQAVYMLEPNVLVWPAELTLPGRYAPPEDAVHPDQSDMERLLRRRLDRVLLYSAPAGSDTADSTRIDLTGGAAELARRTLARLPAADRPTDERIAAAAFRPIAVDRFLYPEIAGTARPDAAMPARER